MYSIRASTPGSLTLTFSEHVSTEEALRAVSQAFALADAGTIPKAICDITTVERGPTGSLVIAAALASRMRSGIRIAFVTTAGQRRYIRRIARFSGIREGLGLFHSVDEASDWLREERASTRKMSSTELRHYRELTRPRNAPGESPAPARRRGAA